tara:strand:- start:8787 stop:8984 length:198 start_codon:yes stop_codon:yes gene_type:complete
MKVNIAEKKTLKFNIGDKVKIENSSVIFSINEVQRNTLILSPLIDGALNSSMVLTAPLSKCTAID